MPKKSKKKQVSKKKTLLAQSSRRQSKKEKKPTQKLTPSARAGLTQGHPKALKRRDKPVLFKAQVRKVNVKIIGIGGGGNSIVSEIAPRIKKERVKFVVANTDLQALTKLGASSKVKRFQLGETLTGGLGTGMDVELGMKAALQQTERIKELLKEADLCIIIACLGGGTGSGAAPVFAKISRKIGNITYGIFTLPFKFEGEKKMEIAKGSLERLKPFVNAFSIIPNERIFKFIDKKTPLKQALSIINKDLTEGLEGLIKMIYLPGVVNIDFADFRTIMKGKEKLAYLSTAQAEGEGRAETVAQKIIFNPLYSYNISGARRVLFNITARKDLGLNEVALISKKVFESVKVSAKIIFGVSRETNMGDKVRVTLLAVGCRGDISLSKQKRSRQRVVSKKKKSPPAAKKQKQESKVSKKRKQKQIKIQTVEVSHKKQESQRAQESKKEEKSSVPLPSRDKGRVKIRRNGLQAKKVIEEIEKEILRKEEIWETPAFLRRKEK